MQPDGVGALSWPTSSSRKSWRRKGLFEQDRKRPIPRYPAAIGVVTSPTGAAVRDILQITARRWPAARIVLCPVLVQGEGAPPQLIQAVRELNRKNACDVIILGRGGGSLEDLWAFNDEGLARAVAASQIRWCRRWATRRTSPSATSPPTCGPPPPAPRRSCAPPTGRSCCPGSCPSTGTSGSRRRTPWRPFARRWTFWWRTRLWARRTGSCWATGSGWPAWMRT